MKRFLIFLSLIAVPALVWAGIPPSEGGLKADNDTAVIPRSLVITDAGILVTNVDLPTVRNPANAFNIPGTAAVTIQCPDAGAWVYTDVTTVSPGRGIMIPAGGMLTTACEKESVLLQFDGGYYRGCVISMAPLAGTVGANAAQCIVHKLRGSY